MYNSLLGELMENNIYLIKDISRIAGLSVYTVKYYLNLGLIKEVGRSKETNFRYFDDTTAEALKQIVSLRKRGVSLGKIGAMVKAPQ